MDTRRTGLEPASNGSTNRDFTVLSYLHSFETCGLPGSNRCLGFERALYSHYTKARGQKRIRTVFYDFADHYITIMLPAPPVWTLVNVRRKTLPRRHENLQLLVF